MNDYLNAKSKVLDEVMDYASEGMADDLKSKFHGPVQSPEAELDADLGGEQEEDLDLSVLESDPAILKMLGSE